MLGKSVVSYNTNYIMIAALRGGPEVLIGEYFLFVP